MGTCFQCGFELEEMLTTYHTRRGEQWYMIEDVPVLFCERCAERYYDAKVIEKIEDMLGKAKKVEKEITVPVMRFKVA